MESRSTNPTRLTVALTNLTETFGWFNRAMTSLYHQVAIAVDQDVEVTVSGIEARHYVRGAMQPEYVDERVQRILRGESAEVAWLSGEHRARIAAAHIRGAAEAGQGRPEVLAWHRLLGREAVSVR
jgi:hypothetical protein